MHEIKFISSRSARQLSWQLLLGGSVSVPSRAPKGHIFVWSRTSVPTVPGSTSSLDASHANSAQPMSRLRCRWHIQQVRRLRQLVGLFALRISSPCAHRSRPWANWISCTSKAKHRRHCLCLRRVSSSAVQGRSLHNVQLFVGDLSRTLVPTFSAPVSPQVQHMSWDRSAPVTPNDLRCKQFCHGCPCDTHISTESQKKQLDGVVCLFVCSSVRSTER